MHEACDDVSHSSEKQEADVDPLCQQGVEMLIISRGATIELNSDLTS